MTARYAKISLTCISLIVLSAGCQQPRPVPEYIYPICEQPFEECSIDLDFYKPAQSRTGSQDANLALAAAISGGGHRAANFAAGVMMGLENLAKPDETPQNILAQIDLLQQQLGDGYTLRATDLYDTGLYHCGHAALPGIGLVHVSIS